MEQGTDAVLIFFVASALVDALIVRESDVYEEGERESWRRDPDWRNEVTSLAQSGSDLLGRPGQV